MRNRAKYERSFIRVRNRIEKKGQKLAFNAIKKQYKAVFDLVGIYSVDQLKEAIDKVVTTAPIVEMFESYYPMFAPLAMMQRNDAIKQKATEGEMWESLFMDQMRRFGLLTAGKKITSITATTEKFIRGAVESAVTEAVESGYGIDKTAKLVRKYLTDSLGDIGRSRAKMIAQTEMISASNQAATFGIESTGYAYKKFWSTSGLENTRATHLDAESESIARGGLKPDETFSNGLRYPGDPNGSADEVINCRCVILHEII